ncbi:hypothetical protein SAMN05216358_0146 [Rhizobium sp. AN5]|uniref:hypothetical protein n=1 Tax=Rhizobium sp. AN5 TaxID=1855304 RepID=UPI000BC98B2E|nr:hypothetical protein [Rhizobium sp. AN5]SOC90122.1 hypothetical protein SAMN05216358_0146 [Rhizobium sp. AN5]
MSEKSPFLRNLSFTNEQANEVAMELENREVEEMNGCTVYSGKHPIHGNIHVVIPAIGDAKGLLSFEVKPVVLRSF